MQEVRVSVIPKLTRRAKHPYIRIVGDFNPALGKRMVGFSFAAAQIANAVRIRRTVSAAFSSNLTRRAKHLHTDIIGKS
jgi:hypothetical protein